ncbi:helix-turn-helix transcriptional regulator [Azospirillum sp.]|uniref:helix-turn-helix transcriptional regulator n=1 Tax=Azospirillum sp. TaxID=34012 RepID=UPI003D72F13D
MAKRNKPGDELPKYMTRRQAAKFLTLSERTLRQLAEDGDGPPFVKLGRRVIYDRDDVVKFMDARKTRRTKGDDQ